jgi:putative sigma-54 modulation protein
MKVTVTARHQEISDIVKRYAIDKSEVLGKYFDRIRRIEVILDVEKDHRYSAEMIVAAPRGHVLVCHSTDSSSTAALDEVVNKMERQLTKFKEKLRKKHTAPKEEVLARFSRRREGELYAGDNFGDLWW